MRKQRRPHSRRIWYRSACNRLPPGPRLCQPRLSPPEILFRDANFAVINKPAGLAVHAGPRGGPSVEDCFPSLSRRRTGPWLAHRLDADTAGCLVIALKRAALLAAQAEFAAGRAEKIYWAVVAGTPATASGTIAAPLRKQTDKTGWRMVIDQNGQPAVTGLAGDGAHRRQNLAGTAPAHWPHPSDPRALRLDRLPDRW